MKLSINQQAFFELLRAGLWEQDVRLSHIGDVDFHELMQIADEQSVIGLVTAGLEHVINAQVPKEDLLQFVGSALQLEQRNKEMNSFVAELVDKMRAADIYTLLIKGQGIAQCYEKPLWRACGDVDLFLSEQNYYKAKTSLIPIASDVDEEDKRREHFALTIDSFVVELHGTINGGISKRERRGLEAIKKDIFEGGSVRSWMNGNTLIFLPSADNDVIIVFTHILEHFFYGGIGFRQLCDWCRLLWKYRMEIDSRALEMRIKRMGLITEWKAFAALAVRDLGMAAEAMPLYSQDRKWSKKSERIREVILETGNFGHKRDNSHYKKYSFLVYKTISFLRNTKDSIRHTMIFPVDATRVWFYRLYDGIRMFIKGK